MSFEKVKEKQDINSESKKHDLNFKKFLVLSLIFLAVIVFSGYYLFFRKDGPQNDNEVEHDIGIQADYSLKNISSYFSQSEILTDTNNNNFVTVTSDLTWKGLIDAFRKKDTKVIKEFSLNFKNLNWNGVFFECKPIIFSSYGKETVEFRIIETSAFENKGEDKNTYSLHFENCKKENHQAISFKSKNKNDLVVPCPLPGFSFNAHIQQFMKNASEDQIVELMSVTGNVLNKVITDNKNNPVWLSTHGTDVSWLHVRICLKPLYYITTKYQTYKNK